MNIKVKNQIISERYHKQEDVGSDLSMWPKLEDKAYQKSMYGSDRQEKLDRIVRN